MADGKLFRDNERFSDQVARGVAGAVDDVRHKLVEEAWFGRETTGSIELVNQSADAATERELGVSSFYGLDKQPAPEKDAFAAEPAVEPAPPPPTPKVEPAQGWEQGEGMER